MPVGATLGAAAVGGVTSLMGANAQKQATDKASATQKAMYEQTRADLAPFRAAGVTGTNALMAQLPDLTSEIKLDNATLQQLPGYNFTRQQGLKAAQNSAAARGLGSSGAATKGAVNFATGTANQYAGDAYNRALAGREQRFNALMGTANLGSNAAAQTGNFATQTGQNIGANTIAGGNAQAAGLVGAGNSLVNGANNYMGYQYANQLLGNGGSSFQNLWAKGTGLY